jgi:acyl-CoA thioesterase YciA
MTEEQNLNEELRDFGIVTRHLVMEKDLNYFGNLFGGVILSWLDEGSALFIMDRIGYSNFVTVSMADVVFKAPARRGDAVVLYSRILSTGRSSVTAQTRAFVHDNRGGRREIIDCKITFVCLQDGKPYAYFESEEYRAWMQSGRKKP